MLLLGNEKKRGPRLLGKKLQEGNTTNRRDRREGGGRRLHKTRRENRHRKEVKLSLSSRTLHPPEGVTTGEHKDFAIKRMEEEDLFRLEN